MDEHVGAVGEDLDGLARRRVAGDDDAAAGAGLPHHLVGRDVADGLAALQAAEVRPVVHAERPRGVDVEPPGPLVLDERVAVGLAAVLDRERRDEERVEADLGVGLEVDELERVAGAPDDRPQPGEQPLGAGRAVDVQRLLARAKVERLEHPEQAEPVVEVEVREEDGVELGEPDRAQQLLLGALAAVEEDAIAAGAQQQRGQAAPRRGHRAGRAGEEQRDVHWWIRG